MDIEAQIIGNLHNNPCSRAELEEEFTDIIKGEFGIALQNLLDDQLVILNKKNQLEITDKAKKMYGF